MNTDLFVAPDAWPSSFCDEIREAMNRGDAGSAEILDADIFVDESVRHALDITVSGDVLARVEHALEQMRRQISEHFALTLSGSVGVTFLRYGAGGRYRRHCDRDPRPGSGTEDRRLSILMWLNTASTDHGRGDFTSGTLVLFPPHRDDAIEVIPVAGTLVAFPSEWPHEVRTVIGGTRDVVVDWWT
ncbi:MAG: 2OG-Fe(II) oxygenase [Vicinamibacterales bacterium]